MGSSPKQEVCRLPPLLPEALEILFPKNKRFLMCLPLVNFKSLEMFLGFLSRPPILCFIFAVSMSMPCPFSTASVSTPRHRPFVCREGPHLESARVVRVWGLVLKALALTWIPRGVLPPPAFLLHRPDSAPRPCRE